VIANGSTASNPDATDAVPRPALASGSAIGAWLAARTPAPPDALRERVAALVRSEELLAGGGATAAELLVRAAERTLRALLRGDPRRRECALDLLAADALVTYGFEAAADAPATIEPLAHGAMARLSEAAEST